ncbi:uncharacterized protein CIMG_09060 [Coccidioides immitis RS]|uniref:Uncharacterized protein n=3 Tax=Coccidioides immitis TaxID=5501 RepID=A0A0E1RUM6_COCIM|nr:uncharacterized protein CIMG_09060 [Coccidioides immitis RS]EAS27856.1 hypothetical protein CIMG_09060 [Coccidioides immitis RS]KMP08644.1 hypothetical protein CIRG_08325 [Coccidioides immitis RMSCC 2394]KMU87463.1 hypothetical protein CIHG_05259 [Coccidioides immitis H538.4]
MNCSDLELALWRRVLLSHHALSGGSSLYRAVCSVLVVVQSGLDPKDRGTRRHHIVYAILKEWSNEPDLEKPQKAMNPTGKTTKHLSLPFDKPANFPWPVYYTGKVWAREQPRVPCLFYRDPAGLIHSASRLPELWPDVDLRPLL